MSIRILIAEDDAVMRHLMATILARHGMSCAVVADGLSAVQAWESEHFDFVVMDVQMPVMDGLKATRMIREKESVRGGHTVIIATTAFAMDEDRQNCLKAGMDEYLSKPLDLELLLDIVKKYAKHEANGLP